MLAFYEMYPEMKEREFWLTGESYGGKYLPLFSYEILERNKNVSESERIPLVSTMISDPLPSPIIERTAVHTVP